MTPRLQDLLTRSAQRDPDRTALVMGQTRLSYGQLESLTNQLARLQAEQGITAGSRVCVVGAKNPWTVAGLLATLKAGGCYVPIDSASPAARVTRILDAAEPSLVLADPTATTLLDDLIGNGGLAAGTPIGALDGPVAGARFEAAFSRADAASLPDEPLRVSDGSGVGDVAHLLFTSGSTGVPKGVMITHSNVVAFVDWAVGYFGYRPTDRISGHPPLHFDLSTFDIYGALAAGAELHLVPAESNVNPRALASFIRDHELTQWFSVPSVLTYLAKFDVVADFPALERLLWCGEVLPTAVLAQLMRRLPQVRFTNLYGPTEATIASSFHTVAACPVDETEPIPIGRPCSGEELLVLDQDRQPVVDGEVGDLYIAGVGLSPGYWRDEEKTAAAFVADPRDPDSRIYRTGDLARYGDDGLVYFLGRADSQIKSRGYRIELGEVEAAVNAIPGVRECAVVGVETGGFEGTTICCAFSALDGADLAPPDLRRQLATMLPAYMLPARWIQLAVLPKNVNGKTDRKDLRDCFDAGLVQSAAPAGKAPVS